MGTIYTTPNLLERKTEGLKFFYFGTIFINVYELNQERYMKSLLHSLFIGLITIFSASGAFAKPINLYEQPKADAKLVGTVETNSGIILIFTPKNSDWIKVGDPRNGNVGWIKQSDLKGTTEFSFSQRFVTTGSAPSNYQVFQYGTPKSLTPEEANAMAKRIQENQAAMQKAIQNMFNNINQSMPVIMPVIFVPEKTNSK